MDLPEMFRGGYMIFLDIISQNSQNFAQYSALSKAELSSCFMFSCWKLESTVHYIIELPNTVRFWLNFISPIALKSMLFYVVI